nr:hypothetical protein TorRG33x02_033400 [Ipomoea trifida]
MMNNVEFKRHSHESTELLHPIPDLLHNLLDRRRPAASSAAEGFVNHHRGEAEMRRLVRPSRQRFKQSRPLRAKRVANINNMQLVLPFESLHDRAVTSHVTESRPRTHLLELQHRLPG